MSLLSTISSISIYTKHYCCYSRYLIYILTEIKYPWLLNLFLILLFHFIVTEMKEDTVNSNALYMVEIENLYVSRNDMLISIF